MLSYPRVFISAGEHSGDRFGASLARALRELNPDIRLSGLGGESMRQAGVRLVADTVSHAGMGFRHTLGNAGQWLLARRRSISEFNREAPDVLVPVDNPEFNLRLASLARDREIPVCYYVSPQVWAWRPGRIHKIGRLVTRMMVILPFEKRLYDQIGVDCTYVGHPLLDYMAEVTLDDEFAASLNTPGSVPVGLLPGSRQQEVLHTFPLFCDAALAMLERVPGVAFHVAAADESHLPMLRGILDSKGLLARIHLGKTSEIMKGARLCLVVSGTATLETAYHRTPMVVAYRAGAGKWAQGAASLLLNTRHICLVNIIGGREVVPEFLKFDDDARPVADAAIKLLLDTAAYDRCEEGLEEVMTAMGSAGSSARAAAAVMECVEGRE